MERKILILEVALEHAWELRLNDRARWLAPEDQA
jgi:hypothetical protein